jgi:hypothetical protein
MAGQWQSCPPGRSRPQQQQPSPAISFLYQSKSSARQAQQGRVMHAGTTHTYTSKTAPAYHVPIRSPAPPDRLVPPPPCTRRRRQRPLQKRRREARPQCRHTITPNRRFNLRSSSSLPPIPLYYYTTGDPRRMEVSVRAQAVAVKGGVMPVSFTGAAEMRIAPRP